MLKRLAMLCSGILLLAGCGGGSGDSFTITSSAAVTSVGAGTPVSATASITSSTGAPVNGLSVHFVSDDPTVIPNVSADTNASGVATVQLATRNIITTTKVVNVYAEYDGQKSQAFAITVNPATLTFTQPADQTHSATVGSGVRIITSGASLQVKDPIGNPVQGATVTLSVPSFTNLVAGAAQVVFYPNGLNETYIPPFTTTLTVTTDSTGTAFIPVAFDSFAPLVADTSYIYTINWLATIQYPGYNGTVLTITSQKQTMITVTATAPPEG